MAQSKPGVIESLLYVLKEKFDSLLGESDKAVIKIESS